MAVQSAAWRVSRPLTIIAGESLDGYVSRVAAAHHFPRISELTQVAGAGASDRAHAAFCDDQGLDALADCLQVEPGVLRHHAPMWSPEGKSLNMFGVQVPKDHLQFAYRRFSPTALKISPHHRALWTSRVLPICTEAWEYLVDRCPNPSCQRQQRWRRTLGIDLCDFCGEPLSRAQAEPVPEDIRGNLQMLVNLMHPEPARREAVRRMLPPRLAAMTSGDLLELACALAPVIDHRAARPLTLRTLSLAKASAVIVPALAGTWPLLAGWPSSLETLFTDRINRNAKNRGDGNNGASYKFLSRFRTRDLPPAVSALISEFVVTCQEARHKGLTVAEASVQTGGQVGALVAMRRAGDIPSVLALDGQRLHVLFDKTAVGKMALKNKPRERLFSAAWHLGIPTYALRELVQFGLIKPALLPPGRTDKLAVCRASLSEFAAQVLDQLGQADDRYKFSLSMLMLRIGGRPKPWASVLESIRAGGLHAAIRSGNAPLAQRIVFKDDAVVLTAAFAERDMDWHGVMITKADAADIMNLSISNFARHRDFLFGSAEGRCDVLMEDAIKLSRQYVSSTELAQRLKVHHLAARHLAEYRGVRVEAVGLFDRASAETLIPEIATYKNGNQASALPDHSVNPELAPMVMQANIAPDGRVKLPAYLCKRIGLTLGGKVMFEETDRGVILRLPAHVG